MKILYKGKVIRVPKEDVQAQLNFMARIFEVPA